MDQHPIPDRTPASGGGRPPERADYRGGFRSTIDEADDRVKAERMERAALADRRAYRMTDADLATIVEACRPVPAIMLQCGTPRSQQQNANDAWCALGDRMGFLGMTVEPLGDDPRDFTAMPGGSPT